MMRMPIFTWTALCSNILIVAAFPVLTAVLALLAEQPRFAPALRTRETWAAAQGAFPTCAARFERALYLAEELGALDDLVGIAQFARHLGALGIQIDADILHLPAPVIEVLLLGSIEPDLRTRDVIEHAVDIAEKHFDGDNLGKGVKFARTQTKL